VLDALEIAHGEIKKLVGAMEELASKAGKEKIQVEAPRIDEGLLSEIQSSHGTAIDEATSVPEKLARQEAIDAIKDAVLAQYAPDTGDDEADASRRSEVAAAFGSLEKSTIRKRIAVDKKRPDGRAQDEIRPIETEVDLSPRVHGSALFTRGETQILSNVALGTTRMDMRLDNLGLQETKTFFHHYNFPPYSVGEAGFMRGPKRRDIGHGALAERALLPTIPSQEDFPYVTRIVSETLESNGSSSMGSVCASSMALQAAGVPVSSPVAGVAMGLIKEGDDVIVLTDIAGVEDHLGDMDFKVAGSEDGINALQMDIKITGVTFEILREALEQARQGRLFILGKMAEAIDGPRPQLSPTAPRIESIKIDPEKIGAVIGKGGETIRGLSEEFEAQIDVEDDGTVRVYAANGELVEACIARIQAMTREAEVGDTFNGKVVKTTTFGAFVELVKGTDGLLHISAVKPGERVDTVEDVLSAGDMLDVTVVEVDRERGRIGLRRSDDPQVVGKSKEELAAVGSGDRGPRGGGGRGGDRGGRGGRDRGGRGGDRSGGSRERRRRDYN
jgi:polyribonucleotide nucleotidyltransferase